MQTTLTSNALTEQEQQKRFSGLEDALGRFRWTGDLRVRGSSYFQKYDGCALCNDRNRARVRVCFGFEGKLNEDFNARRGAGNGDSRPDLHVLVARPMEERAPPPVFAGRGRLSLQQQTPAPGLQTGAFFILLY